MVNHDNDNDNDEYHEVLYSNVPLSFWGGIDPITGIIIDHSHPLCGQIVTDKVLCIPSGRGSCTGSQVMLELILNKTSPKAIILRDADSILCTGAIIAEEFFYEECCGSDNGNNNGSDNSNGSDNGSDSSVSQILLAGSSNYNLLENIDMISLTRVQENSSNSSSSSSSSSNNSSRSSSSTVRIKGMSSNCNDDKVQVSFHATNLLQQHDNINHNHDVIGLHLTLEEQNILHGNHRKGDSNSNSNNIHISRAKTLAMRTIVRVAAVPLLASQSHPLRTNTKTNTNTNTNKKTITKLIPVNSAHIDGVTFIGEGGLRFVEELVRLGGKVAIPTSLNSQSVDRRKWKELGVESTFATKANKVGDAYLNLGCDVSFTCAPYLIPESRPSFGEQIMWGESNAVVYANSVVGARTEKYADYFDICAALIGKVPLVGVHLDENRVPGIVLDAKEIVAEILSHDNDNDNDNVDIDIDIQNDTDSLYPTMGYLLGHLSDGKVPLILGFDQVSSRISADDLKAFCAAYGTTGTSPLFHMAGVTPEASDIETVNAMLKQHEEGDGITVKVEHSHLLDAYKTLDSGGNMIHDSKGDKGERKEEKIDLVAFGNPHLSISELQRLTKLVEQDKRPKHEDVKVMATLSRYIQKDAHKLGYIKQLERFGVTFINDTCWCMMTDEPIIPPSKDATIMTNSGKYAHYGVGLTNRRLRFGSLAECVNASKDGVRLLNRGTNTYLPSWLRKFNSRTYMSMVKRFK